MSTRSGLESKVEDLEQRLAALAEEAKPLRQQIANIDRTRGVLTNQLTIAKEKLAETKKEARVSDHAVIRYFERRHGFTFEATRKEMLTPFVIAAMDAGAESVQAHGGTLKLKGKTVVTWVD